MARYAIGDIQGCFIPFQALLKKVNFNSDRDQLFSVGDIVNRGPHSLAVLRWMYQRRDAVHVVLGNHDLHLLAVSINSTRQKPLDTIEPILAAKDSHILLAWLRQQPLFSVFEDFCLVHAGVWPGWNLEEVQLLAKEVEFALHAENEDNLFTALYGNEPKVWSAALQGADRLRFVINSMTRMRALSADKALNFSYKSSPESMSADLYPWYEFPQQPDIPRIICGHWSALSLYLTPQVWALDTGCVWGQQLTLIDCDTGEVFQQPG